MPACAKILSIYVCILKIILKFFKNTSLMLELQDNFQNVIVSEFYQFKVKVDLLLIFQLKVICFPFLFGNDKSTNSIGWSLENDGYEYA